MVESWTPFSVSHGVVIEDATSSIMRASILGSTMYNGNRASDDSDLILFLLLKRSADIIKQTTWKHTVFDEEPNHPTVYRVLAQKRWHHGFLCGGQAALLFDILFDDGVHYKLHLWINWRCIICFHDIGSVLLQIMSIHFHLIR